MGRIIGITYAGVILGKDQTVASYTLSGKFTFSETYERATVSFVVLVANPVRADFLTDEAGLVAAFRKPQQDLVIVLDTVTRHTFSHSLNTGFNAVPSISKVLDSGTANASTYTCTVSVGLPADLAGRAGRQTSTVDLDTDPSGRRTLAISGTYTALPGSGARAVYDAAIDAYVASVTGGLPAGSWNTLTRKSASDDQDKTISFRHELAEIIHAEGLGTFDLLAVKNQELVITRELSGLRDTDKLGTVTPMVGVRVRYSADIDKDITQDLESLWASFLRPHVIQQATIHSGGGAAVIEREEPVFDFPNNRIAAELRLLVGVGSGLVRARVRRSNRHELGKIIRNVWSGKPFDRNVYEGPQSIVRAETWIYTYLGTGGDPLGSEEPATKDAGDFAGFILVRRGPDRISSDQQGLASGSKLNLTVLTKTFVYVRADIVNTEAPRERPRTGSTVGTFQRPKRR